MGICPLFKVGTKRETIISSELKAKAFVQIETFYQDTLFIAKTDKFCNNGTKRDWEDFDSRKDNETSIAAIKKGLERSRTDK